MTTNSNANETVTAVSGPLLLTKRQAAQRYNLSVPMLDKLRRTKDIPWVHSGSAKVLFPVRETDEWFLSRMVRRPKRPSEYRPRPVKPVVSA